MVRHTRVIVCLGSVQVCAYACMCIRVDKYAYYIRYLHVCHVFRYTPAAADLSEDEEEVSVTMGSSWSCTLLGRASWYSCAGLNGFDHVIICPVMPASVVLVGIRVVHGKEPALAAL